MALACHGMSAVAALAAKSNACGLSEISSRPALRASGSQMSSSTASAAGSLGSEWLGSNRDVNHVGRRIDVASLSQALPHGPRRSASGLLVTAKIRKTKRAPMDPDYPWPDKYKAEEHGFLAFLSKFKSQAPTKKGKLMTLPFEKPLVELESKVEEVRELAKKTGMDFTEQIKELEGKCEQLRRDIYSRLTPVQRLSVARHPSRPTFLDHALNITDKWVELHGDRGGFDDPALVCGIGMIDGMSFMLMGHQKGRNTKENINRNFGMPTPNGYRKALRMMKHAEQFGFPIISFIDTPGAYAGVSAEELGQGEAIAHNLRDMFGLKVPSISVVIGEGGSGGALAIGCCNKMLMLENAVYFVASPEACAAILWKTANAAPKATEELRITGQELIKLNVVDEVISEPLGGAHTDPLQASLNIKACIMKHMRELLTMDLDEMQAQRAAKFRQMGGFLEPDEVDPNIRRNLKKSERPLPDNNGASSRMLPSKVLAASSSSSSPFDAFMGPAEANNKAVKATVPK
eukprot:TRINITY_DN531_c0_g4_i1.p1 TRINITY_DN531_c0_g4~~TRINITY_DN531_c0_g4_i1.p1  ORF type:complete len:518 (-),score=81.83 TRINITY_DN531_c0_g4_i1:905-2458(-)